MQFQYIMSRKDYQKHLEEGYARTSIFYIALFSIFYIIISFNILMHNFWVVVISYLIYVLSMMIVLYLINRLFTYIVLKMNDKLMDNSYGVFECQANDNGIIQQIKAKEYSINWVDVKKVKQTKKSILLFSKKDKSVLFFKKKLFTDNNAYDELVDLINKHCIKDNKKN